MASPCEIASLWNICFANVKGEFHFTSNGVRYFTISARKLFHIRRQPNISLLSPSGLEKHRKLWYNKTRKAVILLSKYFVLKNDINKKQVAIDAYEECLIFNHQLKDAYCPLCNRFIEGSVWEGPYRFYVRSSNLPDILFPLAPVYMLFSKRFVDLFKADPLGWLILCCF